MRSRSTFNQSAASLALWLVIIVVAAALTVAVHARGGLPPPTVIVATPVAKRIIQWDEYTGRFEAVQRVEVRPRVSGYIAAIHFTDGAIVAKGDPLFTIDPRPYEIAVDQARADVVRTQAQIVQAAADFGRAQELLKGPAGTVRELDQRRADLDVDRALEMSAQAALRNAELNLEWTRVVAPISGRISDRRIDVGNLVSGAGEATLLTTIVSLDPIYFVFEGSEADYVRYTRMNALGQRPSSRNVANPVQVRLTDETEWTHTGRMNFVDNEVNEHSGTIRGRAVFDNKDYFFTPGTFGRLRLFGGYQDVLLVPDAAIVSDQAKKVVYTIGPDNRVVAQPVALAGIVLGLRAITDGLSPNNRVIIGGLANPFVHPGVIVQAQTGEIKQIEPLTRGTPDGKSVQVKAAVEGTPAVK